MVNMEKQNNGITLSKRALVILILLILLLLAGGVALGMNWSRLFGSGSETAKSETTETESSETGSSTADGYSPEIDPNAAEWDGTLTGDTDDDDEESVGIKIPGYPSISVAAGEETIYVALLNPEGNPCYFTFTLVLKDTDEVLYTSGLVPPGQAITTVTMSRALEAGEYDAVLQITTTSLEDGSAMNGANVETVLIVE